ncbi:MAG TPA: DNA-binding protein [Mycobacterium sp.]|nr:DNA-binding protein [Mycobacterium sp.]
MIEDVLVGRLVVANKRRARRVPASLDVDATGRGRLESALEEVGLAIIVESDVPPTSERDGGKARLRDELEALVDEADESEVARLEAAATAPRSDDLEERFWGPTPDPVTSVEAVVADLREQFSHRRQMAADSISRDAAAELLGIAAQSVTAKLDSRKLVGIKVGREWRLPRWQFIPDNISGVLPDLDILQEAFPGGPVSLSQWMTATNPEFDGQTPREAMIVRGGAPVVKVARALTAAGW